jgi:hypothetical protein
MLKRSYPNLKYSKRSTREKYLGLPTAIGRSTTKAFEKLTTRIQNPVNGWSEKKLSSARREVLIKAVAQPVPKYSMSCFELSKTTCKRITSSVARYWWGGDSDRRKMHGSKWSEITHMKKRSWYGF